jgi:hypothetical protein
MQRPIPRLLAMTFAMVACSDRSTVTGPIPTSPSENAVKFWEDNAAVYWNGVANGLAVKYAKSPFETIRNFGIVSVAGYNAAATAETAETGREHPSAHAAISAASVVTLTYLYPAEAGALEARLDEYLAAEGWPGKRNTDDASGEVIGRDIAAQVVTRAQGDRFFAPWTSTVPTGPGKWFGATPPVGAMWGQAKPYFLLSGDQFRPPPPPAFGSPEFLAALAEVRQIADTRTAEQDRIAKFWAANGPGYFNEQARTLAVRYRRTERETAHLLALMNMAAFDCVIVSHEAKFFFWLLRPNMADPRIKLAIPQPNFPSYTSNHAVISAGITTILGTSFPADRERLDSLAEEAAFSRIYAGIHYRFDSEVGLALGRTVAGWALAHDVNGHEPFVLK